MAPVFGKEIGFSTTQIATLLVVTMAGAIVFSIRWDACRIVLTAAS